MEIFAIIVLLLAILLVMFISTYAICYFIGCFKRNMTKLEIGFLLVLISIFSTLLVISVITGIQVSQSI